MTEDAQLKLRVPQELKEFIEAEAKANHRTINGEVLYRLEQSKNKYSTTKNPDVRIIDLKNGKRRLVFGKFANSLDLDYTQSLTELKRDIELSLNALRSSSFSKKLAFFNKDVYVHQGGHHIDVVDNGVGSLNWLRIEDHWVGDSN